MTRSYYPDSRVEVSAWEDQEAFECDDAEVWIEDGSMLISYFDADGIVVLEGHLGPGNGWALVARSRPRRATLRPIGSDVRGFEGSIDEQGVSIRWTLRLGTPATPD